MNPNDGGRKWTPGPWRWSQGVDDWEIVGAGANRVLFCWNDGTKWKSGLIVGENIREADAKLIAAAPDMAEALMAAPNPQEYESPDDYGAASAEWFAGWRKAALAKAGVA